MERSETVRRRLNIFETLNTVCWVSLDVSWFFQAKPACAIFAVPTVLTCLAVFRYTEKRPAALLVSGAVAFWACFNVFWVLGDLKMLAWGLPAAKVFIALLAVCMLCALAAAILNKEARQTILTRFRRIRLGRR